MANDFRYCMREGGELLAFAKKFSFILLKLLLQRELLSWAAVKAREGGYDIGVLLVKPSVMTRVAVAVSAIGQSLVPRGCKERSSKTAARVDSLPSASLFTFPTFTHIYTKQINNGCPRRCSREYPMASRPPSRTMANRLSSDAGCSFIVILGSPRFHSLATAHTHALMHAGCRYRRQAHEALRVRSREPRTFALLVVTLSAGLRPVPVTSSRGSRRSGSPASLSPVTHSQKPILTYLYLVASSLSRYAAALELMTSEMIDESTR